jgi:hypothetical protein
VRRMRDSPTARALRHRSGQATALFLLALLGVAACVFGPLYGRSVEAAVLVGAAVGVLAARLTLPAVPMFVQDAPEPAVLLPVAWGRVLLATAATLLAVGVVSAAAAAVGPRPRS